MGFEPTTDGITIRGSNLLNYRHSTMPKTPILNGAGREIRTLMGISPPASKAGASDQFRHTRIMKVIPLGIEQTYNAPVMNPAVLNSCYPIETSYTESPAFWTGGLQRSCCYPMATLPCYTQSSG